MLGPARILESFNARRHNAAACTSFPLADLSNSCVSPVTMRTNTSDQFVYGVNEFAAISVTKFAMAGSTALRKYLPITWWMAAKR
jgi:hypothetical protein